MGRIGTKVMWLPRPADAQRRIDALMRQGYLIVEETPQWTRLEKERERAPEAERRQAEEREQERNVLRVAVAVGVVTLAIALGVGLWVLAVFS